jgi:hypothetical protein
VLFRSGISGTAGSGTFRGIFAAFTAYALGDRIAPTRAYANAAARAYIYECTTAGTSAATEPTWSFATPETSTTTSNTAVFTCRYIDDWTNAGMYFAQGIQAASAAGDILMVHYTFIDLLDADTTYTIAASIDIICVDKDSSDALTTQGTSYYIGHDTSNRSILFTSTGRKVYIYGLTFRVSSASASDVVQFNGGSGNQYLIEKCYIYLQGANSHSLSIGTNTENNDYAELIDCTVNFNNAGQRIYIGDCRTIFRNLTLVCNFQPTYVFAFYEQGPTCTVEASNLSAATGTLVSEPAQGYHAIEFINCKLGTTTIISGWTTITNNSSGDVYLYNCSTSDTHYHIAHYNGCGSTVCDTNIYANDHICDTALSWKIVTYAPASYVSPYKSPWIPVYNDDVSTSITPYIEILRDKTVTPTVADYKNDEVWGEFSVQDTSGYPLAVITNDCKANKYAANADQDDGVGLAGWTGEGAYAWSGKLVAPAAVTPNEVGHVMARVVVALASTTLYVDPQVRGLA